MGEYASFNGEQVKLGTCEDLYYLRADQRHLIDGYNFDEAVSGVIRYRFPFPDEDHTEPGQFEDYDRGVRIPGWELPADFEGHYVDDGDDCGSDALLRQQRFVDGELVSVVACSSCGAAWRLESIEAARPVIDAFRSRPDRFSRTIAERIEAGYLAEAAS